MDISQYIQERLDPQIGWHDARAQDNKARFHLFQTLILISGALVPAVNAIIVVDLLTRIVSSLLGVMVAVATGVAQLKKYQDNWILYRTNAELLKKEKYFFNTDAGAYSDTSLKDRDKLLVERVESIISSETSKYFAMLGSKQHSQENQ